MIFALPETGHSPGSANWHVADDQKCD